ncbi:MAG: TIGR04222 domain-containing membrane protein, partial [Myxococcota bacterium]
GEHLLTSEAHSSRVARAASAVTGILLLVYGLRTVALQQAGEPALTFGVVLVVSALVLIPACTLPRWRSSGGEEVFSSLRRQYQVLRIEPDRYQPLPDAHRLLLLALFGPRRIGTQLDVELRPEATHNTL